MNNLHHQLQFDWCLIPGLCLPTIPQCPCSSPSHLAQEESLPLNSADWAGPSGHSAMWTFSHSLIISLQKLYISLHWSRASPCPTPFRLATQLQSHGLNDRSGDDAQHDGKRTEEFGYLTLKYKSTGAQAEIRAESRAHWYNLKHSTPSMRTLL